MISVEFEKTNGAFEAVFFFPEIFNGGVRKSGKRINDSKVKTGIYGRSFLWLEGIVGYGISAVVETPSLHHCVEKTLAKIESEETNEEEDEEDYGEDHRERRCNVMLWRRLRWQR